jgi:hypothetical protein
VISGVIYRARSGRTPPVTKRVTRRRTLSLVDA